MERQWLIETLSAVQPSQQNYQTQSYTTQPPQQTQSQQTQELSSPIPKAVGAVQTGRTELKPAKKMPDNPEKMNPLMLMNLMLPHAQWDEVGKSGLVSNEVFTFNVTVDGKQFTGTGTSKKSAKNLAAFAACHQILNINYPDDVWTQELSSPIPKAVGAVQTGRTELKSARKMPDNPEKMNPLMLMNLMLPHAQWDEVGKSGLVSNEVFTFNVTVDGKQFTGTGTSKKSAKNLAAFAACHQILNINYPDDVWTQELSSPVPKAVGAVQTGRTELKSARKMPDNPEKMNPLMLMNLMLPHAQWDEVGKSGLVSNEVFTFNVTVDGKQFTGTGTNKKSAKNLAAFAACHQILNINYPDDVWARYQQSQPIKQDPRPTQQLPAQVQQQTPAKPTPAPTPTPTPVQNSPVVPGANPPPPEECNGENVESAESDGKKRHWYKQRGRVSKAEKGSRRNLKLSKILQPKNAVMILNELVKGCQYTIDELPCKIDANQFRASVSFEEQEFAGTGHNQQPFVQNQNKFSQHAGDRLLAALSKTANVFSANNANIKKCNIQPTIAKTQEQAVAKGKSPSTSLDEDIATQVASTEKSPLLNFHFIYEEREQAYKTFKNAQKLEKQREENSQDATTQKVTADEATVKNVKLLQTREELIAKTKETTLYKAYQELVRKDTLPDKKYPKTPETAIATSRWKENYFKPWKFDLTQFGYRFLNRIFEENDEDASGE